MNKILSVFIIFTASLFAAMSQNSEDTYSLYAFDTMSKNKPEEASEVFRELYERTSKIDYLYQSLGALSMSNNRKKFIDQSNKYYNLYSSDDTITRYYIISLMRQQNLEEASKIATKLSDKTQKEADYQLLADIKHEQKDLDAEIDILNIVYVLGKNPDVLAKLLAHSVTLGKTDMIEVAAEHLKTRPNSISLGNTLGWAYVHFKRYNEAKNIYKKTFEEFKDLTSALHLISLHLNSKDYNELKPFLEKYELNDALLLELYAYDKEFNKASTLADKLFKATQESIYLAKSAVFAYEAAQNKNDKELLDSIRVDLTKANETLEEPLYQNYLGYLLIDHDLDVKSGMEYVKKALLKEPKSPYYIDSLAWGHYKLGECDEAKKLIQEVREIVGDSEPEVNDHLKAINNCKRKN